MELGCDYNLNWIKLAKGTIDDEDIDSILFMYRNVSSHDYVTHTHRCIGNMHTYTKQAINTINWIQVWSIWKWQYKLTLFFFGFPSNYNNNGNCVRACVYVNIGQFHPLPWMHRQINLSFLKECLMAVLTHWLTCHMPFVWLAVFFWFWFFWNARFSE